MFTTLQKKRAKLWQYGKSRTAVNVLHHRQGQRGIHCTSARYESTWLIAASWSIVHKNGQNPVRRSCFGCLWPVLATVATWKGQNVVRRSPARDLFAVWCKQVYCSLLLKSIQQQYYNRNRRIDTQQDIRRVSIATTINMSSIEGIHDIWRIRVTASIEMLAVPSVEYRGTVRISPAV